MYLAGMIAEPKKMVEEDFNRWIDSAYFYMISEFIVAVTLAETDIAFSVAEHWIDRGKELEMAAGISYLPLHEEAKEIAREVGKVDVFMGKKLCITNVAIEYIQNGFDKGKIGFKRKHVRC